MYAIRSYYGSPTRNGHPVPSGSGAEAASLSTEAPTRAAVDVTTRDEASLLPFLMDAAAELGSTLELEKVFHKIATELRPLIDYHLFCVMLWNEHVITSYSIHYTKLYEAVRRSISDW